MDMIFAAFLGHGHGYYQCYAFVSVCWPILIEYREKNAESYASPIK